MARKMKNNKSKNNNRGKKKTKENYLTSPDTLGGEGGRRGGWGRAGFRYANNEINDSTSTALPSYQT